MVAKHYISEHKTMEILSWKFRSCFIQTSFCLRTQRYVGRQDTQL